MVYGRDSWIYDENGIILDSEFDSDAIGWKHGDYFKFINVNGKQILIKVEELETFLLDGKLKS